MLVLDQIVQVRWNGTSMNHYIERGYIYTKTNELFECKLEDLMKGSGVNVKVICDYCGEPFYTRYVNYFKGRKIIQKDCCSNRKCMMEKSKEVQILTTGVDNPMKRKECVESAMEKHRTPFSDVIKLCKEKNITLLNDKSDYINDRSRLQIICNNHPEFGIQDTCFANIKANKGCCYYGKFKLVADSSRKSGEEVYQEFINKGFIPQFNPDDYINNSTSLPYICSKHKNKGVQNRAYGNLKDSIGCPYCAKESTANKLRLSQDFVFGKMLKKGLIPLEDQTYKNKEDLIYYRCIKHPDNIQYTSYGNFRVVKQTCSYCRAEESLASLNRRLRSSISKWRKKSEKKDNFKCVLTKNKDYEIHHLFTFNNIIKEALNLLNIELQNKYSGEEIILIKNKVVELHKNYPLGICLDRNLHILFHQLYGKSDNTLDQFEEFKTRYKLGEFEDTYIQVSSFS